MTVTEIAERMAQDAEGIAAYLFPSGKLIGHEWCVGSIGGEPGCSLKVNCGNRAGVWKDFAGGEKGGDLIDLYMAVKGCTKKEAVDFGKQWCKIVDPTFTNTKSVKARKPLAPLKRDNISDEVMAWFNARGLSQATLEKYRIVSDQRTAALPYYIGGELMHVKYRDTSKGKKEQGAWMSSKDSTQILFGWQAIPDSCREIVITEGEFDALAYAEQGHPALSIPSGAGNGGKLQWIDLDYERLEMFDTIYLSLDMDEEGQKHVSEIANRLGLHRTKIVKLPRKDANDCLLAFENLGDFLAAARTIDPVELKPSRDFMPEVEEMFRPTRTDRMGLELPWSFTAEKFLVRPGELTVWTGFNGSGKSMILSHVSVGLIKQGERVCIASMEMSPAATLKRMFQQIGATACPPPEYLDKMDAWLADNLWIVNIRGTAKADRLLEIFRYAWKRYGVTQIIIDSLLKCGFNEDDYNGQKHFVDNLCDFIAETQCHIHLVSHARKLENELQLPGKMDVRGGAALTDLPDNVITVWRNKQKEEKITDFQVSNPTLPVPPELSRNFDAVIQVHKQRHADWEGKIPLFFDRVSHQYRSGLKEAVKEYV